MSQKNNESEVYLNEFQILEKAEKTHTERKLSQEDLWQAYSALIYDYQKLLKSSKKITRIGDKYQKKTIYQKDRLAKTLEELKRTQKRLVETEKMASLGNLVAGVAHEINTPLGIGVTVSSSLLENTKEFATMYENDDMSRDDLEEYLEKVYESSRLILQNMQRASDLVQSFKKVSVDQSIDDKRKFFLLNYITDVICSLSPHLKKKSIATEIDIEETLEIDSFPGIFAQIITNLVVNSVVHGFQGCHSGKISLKAYDIESKLILNYKDNGRGIASDILPKIFDPFFTTNKQSGTGLGLNIVYNLVTQKLQGNITCKSEEGTGTSFEICLQK